MGLLDLFTGAASNRAARNNQAAISTGLTNSANALTTGANNAVATLGTTGRGTALDALGQGYGQARSDLGASNEAVGESGGDNAERDSYDNEFYSRCSPVSEDQPRSCERIERDRHRDRPDTKPAVQPLGIRPLVKHDVVAARRLPAGFVGRAPVHAREGGAVVYARQPRFICRRVTAPASAS